MSEEKPYTPEWTSTEVGGSAATTCFASDRRMGRRVPSLITTKLRCVGCRDLVCEADEVGEGGIHLRVPLGFGLATGQRYELTFDTKSGLPELANVVGETRYATVVRTEVRLDTSPHEVGVGMCFDSPLFL